MESAESEREKRGEEGEEEREEEGEREREREKLIVKRNEQSNAAYFQLLHTLLNIKEAMIFVILCLVLK